MAEELEPLTKEQVELLTTLVCRTFAKAEKEAPDEIRGAMIIALLEEETPLAFLGTGGVVCPVRREVRCCARDRLREWAIGVLEVGKEDDDGS